MIEVYKIMSGKYDPEISNIFQHQYLSQHLLVQNFKLFSIKLT